MKQFKDATTLPTGDENLNVQAGVTAAGVIKPLLVASDGSLAAASAPPTGASTSDKQDTGNLSLAYIDDNTRDLSVVEDADATGPLRGVVMMFRDGVNDLAPVESANPLPIVGNVNIASEVVILRSPDELSPADCTSVSTIASQDVADYATVVVQIFGTFSGTVSFFGSADGGATYVALAMLDLGSTSLTLSTSTTAPGIFQRVISGLSHIRVTCSAYTSGTISTRIRSSS